MFKVFAHHAGVIRLGELVLPSGTLVKTPTMIVTTKQLCIPHLTPDAFEKSLPADFFAGLLVHWEPLLEDHALLLRTCPMPLYRFLGHHIKKKEQIWLATREPDYYLERTGSSKNGLDWIWVQTEGGMTMMSLRGCFRPDVLSRLAPDVVLAPTDHYLLTSTKVEKVKSESKDDEKVDDESDQSSKNNNENNKGGNNCSQGGHERDQSGHKSEKVSVKRMTRATENVHNYWRIIREAAGTISSPLIVPSVALHTLPKDNYEPIIKNELERRAQVMSSLDSPLIALSLDEIRALPFVPKDLPAKAIFLRNPVAPEEIHHYLAAGIDIFETFYATDLATQGIAITFDLEHGFDQYGNIINCAVRLNMSESINFDDFTPLAKDCNCMACHGSGRTTRAYIHHLVMTKEMLASVYLSSHNLWQYGNYFAYLRKKLAP